MLTAYDFLKDEIFAECDNVAVNYFGKIFRKYTTKDGSIRWKPSGETIFMPIYFQNLFGKCVRAYEYLSELVGEGPNDSMKWVFYVSEDKEENVLKKIQDYEMMKKQLDSEFASIVPTDDD